ncbi:MULTISPECIES: hypothetical protein [Pseudomonas]|uniref:hypothetical protein n=1 Tax=Pseudomonas TaxID=286 RepID=UPI00070998B6|nr:MULTISPECIES: hypothetical protein [Pseudomonas]KQW19861.1 hypothetical protein ASC85_08415 [Pseudomonas sp. Root401]PWD02051.1 hypothetical protein CX658_19050 [Pseudomonas amygdali pv. lachrymans]WHS57447.1 hypothetical protein QLH64_30990 [Pseudomonas brassicacearum]WNZ87471.1 hypothetical protein QOM10_29755 [Pseudomonas sp. P108]
MKFMYAVTLFCAVTSAQAADVKSISLDEFAGDKRAQKIENLKTTANQYGTTTVVALLTYADGEQETCTFVMVANLAEKDGEKGLNVTPKSRSCTPAAKAN